MQKTIILSALLLLATGLMGQSQTVATFADRADGYKVFLYQSVIRALNQDANPDFNRLIEDLDHIRLLTTEEGDEDAETTFRQLDRDVQAEGFEPIMTFDNAEGRCHVYELSSDGKQSTWVATLFMGNAAGVMEMKGSLNLKYLRALSSVNMDKLKELLPVGE